MLKEDIIGLSLAYLSIPIMLLILNTNNPNGLFIHNDSIIDLGNYLCKFFMFMGLVIITGLFSKS